jgi:hypothetical protein
MSGKADLEGPQLAPLEWEGRGGVRPHYEI